MKRFAPFLFAGICLSAVVMSCDEIIPSVPDDISGISLKSVDVLVEYTAAKVYGEIRISQNPERISEVRVQYGTSADNLSKSVRAAYDTENGFSADLTSLEDGVQFFYRVDIIVGKTPIEGTVKDFVTFPQGPIDLDLPSGKRWASHNVGANIPTERGDHFAWGETSTKEQYSWSTYKYCSDGDYLHKLTKYVVDDFASATGTPDNIVTLKESDDAATANMGKGWSTPTRQEWQELIDNGLIKSVTINGVRGVTISSKKDMNNNKKCIFVPAYPGKMSGTQFDELGSSYWTATLNDQWMANQYARVITTTLGTDFYTTLHSDRCNGLSVRAIMR